MKKMCDRTGPTLCKACAQPQNGHRHKRTNPIALDTLGDNRPAKADRPAGEGAVGLTGPPLPDTWGHRSPPGLDTPVDLHRAAAILRLGRNRWLTRLVGADIARRADRTGRAIDVHRGTALGGPRVDEL